MRLEDLVPAETVSAFVNDVSQSIDNPMCVKKKTILEIGAKYGIRSYDLDRTWLSPENRSATRGYYAIPMIGAASSNEVVDFTPSAHIHTVEPQKTRPMPPVKPPAPPKPIRNVSFESISCKAEIPESDPCFVPWGNYSDIKRIIKSEMFFPVYISGHAGNGKSLQIKHICAELKRPFVRVQFTSETGADDLIGTFRLENNDGVTITRFVDGPVITAMKTPGCVLLLDEVDRGSSSLLELQGVLEGEPVLIKKTGEIVHPAKGFTIVATGNTKGRGSDSGRYTFANIIDEAFLERFTVDLEQSFPKKDQLSTIFNTYINKNEGLFKDLDRARTFADELAAWGTIINETFMQDGVDETISIRRLVHAMKTFSVFNNEKKAIQMTTNRYDEINRDAFFDLFRKVTKLDFDGKQEDDTADDDVVVDNDPIYLL